MDSDPPWPPLSMNLLLANSFFHPAIGGIENYLLNAGRALVAQGHGVTVLTGQHRPDLELRSTIDDIQIHRYPFDSWDVPWAFFNARRRVRACREAARRLFAAERFDAVWARDLFSHAAVASVSACPPIVYIQAVAYELFMRAAYPAPVSGRWKVRLYRAIEATDAARWGNATEGRLLRRCQARVVLSAAKRREIAAHYHLPETAFEVVPAGVDVNRYHPVTIEEKRALRARLGLPEDAFVFLFVGRFSIEKNPVGLLRAFEGLTNLDGKILAMVGPGREAIERQAALGPAARSVRFAGEVREPVEWYAAADAFVLPSLTEGFGQVILEAMASGLPVIGFRSPSGSGMLATEEIVEEGKSGRIVEYGDQAALTRAMEEMAADRTRAVAMGRHGRNACIERYSWARVVERLVHLTVRASSR